MKKLLFILAFLGMGSAYSFGLDVGPDINRYFQDPVTSSKIRNACHEYHSLIQMLESLQKDRQASLDFIQRLLNESSDLNGNLWNYLAQGRSYLDLMTTIGNNNNMITRERRRVLSLQADIANAQGQLLNAWIECELMKQKARDEYEIAKIAEELEDLKNEPAETQ